MILGSLKNGALGQIAKKRVEFRKKFSNRIENLILINLLDRSPINQNSIITLLGHF